MASQTLGVTLVVFLFCALGHAKELRLNHMQAKGTHNSYHVAPFLPVARALNYTHAPLDIQLSKQGVRHFELDVHRCGSEHCVFHLGFIDPYSTCNTFSDCLRVLKNWSDQNPKHHMLFVVIEPKDTHSTPGTKVSLALLETEILSMWPRSRILTPQAVQGNAKTLRDAVTSQGWPSVEKTRGQIAFILFDEKEHRDQYCSQDPATQEKLMFVLSSAERLDAAFIRIDEPRGHETEIQELVKQGFMIRTRADADVNEPANADFSRLNAALGSGAQLISTDFPSHVDGWEYWVDMPGGMPTRCNPVMAPSSCRPNMIEMLKL
jgi:hypothetical protein